MPSRSSVDGPWCEKTCVEQKSEKRIYFCFKDMWRVFVRTVEVYADISRFDCLPSAG